MRTLSTGWKLKRRVAAVSEFELSDLGDGRFALAGDLSFDTAEQIRRASQIQFSGQDNIEVDLSRVGRTDSAGLALLLDWISWAGRSEVAIRFSEIPEKILAIAQTAEVGELLSGTYSSSQPTP